MLQGGLEEERCNPFDTGSRKRTHNSKKSSHIWCPKKDLWGVHFRSDFSSREPGRSKELNGVSNAQGFALGGHRGMGIPLTAEWACCSSVNNTPTNHVLVWLNSSYSFQLHWDLLETIRRFIYLKRSLFYLKIEILFILKIYWRVKFI